MWTRAKCRRCKTSIPGRVAWKTSASSAHFGEDIHKLKSEAEKPAVHYEDSGEDAMSDEEADAEADSLKKLEMRKHRLRWSCARVRTFKNVDEDCKKNQKDQWRQELAHIDQTRNDMSPEHEKLQRRSPT